MLRVGYVDRDSARRLASGQPLLERCAFRRVASFVDKNLGQEAAFWVTNAQFLQYGKVQEPESLTLGTFVH